MWIYIVIAGAVIMLVMYSMGACGTTKSPTTYTVFTERIGLISTPVTYGGDDLDYEFEMRAVTMGETGLLPGTATDIQKKEAWVNPWAITEQVMRPKSSIYAIAQQGNYFYVLEHGYSDQSARYGAFLKDPEQYCTYFFYYQQIYDISAIWQAYNSFMTAYSAEMVEYVTGTGAGQLGLDFEAENFGIPGFAGLSAAEKAEKLAFVRHVRDLAGTHKIYVTSLPPTSSWFNFTNIINILFLVVMCCRCSL